MNPTPINVEEIDLELLRKKTTDLPGLIEYAHTVGGFAIEPTREGAIKSRAMKAMQEQTKEKMDMIMEQMKVLARQAQELKERVEVSEQIYLASVSFEPIVGEIYYLYKRNGGQNVLSLIGPDEWGSSSKYERFLAKIRLGSDHTWKVLEKGKEEDWMTNDKH
ncbi:MAG: DUF2452 domain-containing protein [Bdellovibrio sp.]|nr:DUF2452 domain-containing protein [Bdellovibrio sp.]